MWVCPGFPGKNLSFLGIHLDIQGNYGETTQKVLNSTDLLSCNLLLLSDSKTKKLYN